MANNTLSDSERLKQLEGEMAKMAEALDQLTSAKEDNQLLKELGASERRTAEATLKAARATTALHGAKQKIASVEADRDLLRIQVSVIKEELAAAYRRIARLKVNSSPDYVAAITVRPALGQHGELVFHVIDMVSQNMGIDPENLRTKTRMPQIVKARWIFWYVMREVSELSYPQLGRMLGDYSHTAVIHGVAKVKHSLADDPDMAWVPALITSIKHNQPN
ncbi:hypothetical protein EPO04_03510 [Patescibacteria group bacterium]|nr:MAG: hypothetical protein EPO04_03510 [Patescibacteria group bacterium]